MSEVVCLGELIVDMISSTRDASIEASESFFPTPGGAPANVAVGLVRQGVSASYIGKVGEDAFGRLMFNTMLSQGVDASGIDTRIVTCLPSRKSLSTGISLAQDS